MNHSRYHPNAPERYNIVLVEIERMTMARYWKGLWMMREICVEASDMVMVGGETIYQMR